MTEELKPCPFCGSKPLVQKYSGAISCPTCALSIPEPQRNYEVSGKIWNSFIQKGESNPTIDSWKIKRWKSKNYFRI